MRDIGTYSEKELLAGLGRTLKNARMDRGMLQADVAEASGLSQFSISQIENGRNTSMQSLIAILRALDRLDIVEPLIDNSISTPIVSGYGQTGSESALCDSALPVGIDWKEFDEIAAAENKTRESLLKNVIDIFISVRRENRAAGFMKYKGIAASITDEEIDSDIRLRRMFAR